MPLDERMRSAVRRIWAATWDSVEAAAEAVRTARAAGVRLPAAPAERVASTAAEVVRTGRDVPDDTREVERRMAIAMRWADVLDEAHRALDQASRAALGARWDEARRAMRGLPWTEAPIVARGRAGADGWGVVALIAVVLFLLARARPPR